jgi:hypothetical protein
MKAGAAHPKKPPQAVPLRGSISLDATKALAKLAIVGRAPLKAVAVLDDLRRQFEKAR